MIEDDELDALPDDPLEAFVAFHRIIRSRLDDLVSNSNYRAERTYVVAMLQFIAVHGLQDLINFPNPPSGDPDFSEYYVRFEEQIEASVLAIRFASAKDRKRGKGPTLLINADARQTLHGYLNEMRGLLDGIDLPNAKREAILNKINALAAEIDTNRTKWESVMALSIELADTVEAVDKRLSVLRRVYDSIQKRLGKSVEEAKQLPSPSEPPKQIEGPKEALSEADDDIPF